MGRSAKHDTTTDNSGFTVGQKMRDGNQWGNISRSHIEIGSKEGKSLLGTIAGIATIVATIIGLLAYFQIEPNKGPSHGVTTKIVNTGPDGVFAYPQPENKSHYQDGYLEGQSVVVVCQKRDGVAMTDKDPAPGQPPTWSVWDKLDNGRWIPDLWTNLPKNPGDTPPDKLPTC